MSFTADVKEELCRVQPVCSHCDKALLSALVRIEGTLLLAGAGRCSIEIATDSPSVARLVVRLAHSLYNLDTTYTIRRSVLHKTPNYLIQVPNQNGLVPALADMGIMDSHGLVAGIDSRLVEKRCCQAAYLRGVFLGSGFVANPRGDFHFEMTVESKEFADDVVEILASRGVAARSMQRRSNYIVYMKSGNAISEFLALAGAHQGALAMENERVVKSVRNDVNRQVNAEMANQQKTTDAAIEQLLDIRTVVGAYGMANLPPALQDFVRLRVANPEATLRELGELAQPPLSKSAVYHRVRRLEQLASQVRNGVASDVPQTSE